MATKTNKTGSTEPKMWRVNQRAHTFTDRKKDANKKACRGKGWS